MGPTPHSSRVSTVRPGSLSLEGKLISSHPPIPHPQPLHKEFPIKSLYVSSSLLYFRKGPLEGTPFVDDYISTSEQVLAHEYFICSIEL